MITRNPQVCIYFNS